MLNNDSYREQELRILPCDCDVEEETVTHMLLHCNKYSQAGVNLIDTLEVWMK